MNQVDLGRLFLRIPLLEHQSPDDFSISQLPGYTNLNYRLVNQTADWVLRIPRSATNPFIDRAAEAANQDRACDLGIAPRPLWREDSGLTLTPTLAASRGLNPADLTDASKLPRLVEPLVKLHRSGLRFQGRVDLERLLLRYFSLLSPALQEKFQPRLRTALQMLAPLRDRDIDYVASHNDLVLQNLLLQQDRLWLIDWEFSAMASPYWDLATICNAADFDYRQSRQLLDAYCVGAESMEESLLFDYRNLLQLLSECWMAALVN